MNIGALGWRWVKICLIGPAPQGLALSFLTDTRFGVSSFYTIWASCKPIYLLAFPGCGAGELIKIIKGSLASCPGPYTAACFAMGDWPNQPANMVSGHIYTSFVIFGLLSICCIQITKFDDKLFLCMRVLFSFCLNLVWYLNSVL